MNRLQKILTGCLLIFVLSGQISGADPKERVNSAARKIYLIGNSLTWDTVPFNLDESVQWHVDCGKSLKFIYENPNAPCVKTSTLWPKALKETQFDIISFQPHYGTTIEQDLETISKWIEMQPDAVIIIHTGWAKSASLFEEYKNGDAGKKLPHSPEYFNELMKRLRDHHPETEFRTIHCMRLLIELNDKIAQGKAPADSVTEFYRDVIHMKVETGRYLMHNAMRETIGQKRTTNGFPKISSEMRAFLDSLLDQRNSWDAARPAGQAKSS